MPNALRIPWPQPNFVLYTWPPLSSAFCMNSLVASSALLGYMCYKSHMHVYRAPVCIELRGFRATSGPAQAFKDLVTSLKGRIKVQIVLQKHICCGAWEFRSLPDQLAQALWIITILPASVFLYVPHSQFTGFETFSRLRTLFWRGLC